MVNLYLVFDLLLALTLMWVGWRTLTSPDLFRGVVLFIAFGVLMTLAWVRLEAPDVAMAEAAIGAGLTGALLLDALADLRARRSHQDIEVSRLAAVSVITLALAGVLSWVMLTLPAQHASMHAPVTQPPNASGITNPVTLVLLVYRAYDTLLEMAVLLLAVIGARALHDEAPVGRAAPQYDLLAPAARVLLPAILLVAAYLLWAGATRPGGAFQAGAVLGAAGVLLRLAGLLPSPATYRRWMQMGLVSGFMVFLLVGVLVIFAGLPWLGYPATHTKALILLVETGLTLSIGMSLLSLFMSVPEQRSPSTHARASAS